MSQPVDLKDFVISVETSIAEVDCKKAFSALQLKEKLYVANFARASWIGSKICYFQRSYESPALFYLFQTIFNAEDPKELRTRLVAEKILSEVEVAQVYVYIGSFFDNCGNYKSFGDCKFVPEIPVDRFWAFITATVAYKQLKEQFETIWEATSFELYAVKNPY